MPIIPRLLRRVQRIPNWTDFNYRYSVANKGKALQHMERNPGYRLSHHASLGFSQSRKDVISAATSCQCPVGTLQKQTDMHHAFVRLVELWRKFEEVLDRWARTEVGAHAGAADSLFRLEEARFLAGAGKILCGLEEAWAATFVGACGGVRYDRYEVDRAD